MFVEDEVKTKWHTSELLKKIDGFLQVSLAAPASSGFQFVRKRQHYCVSSTSIQLTHGPPPLLFL